MAVSLENIFFTIFQIRMSRGIAETDKLEKNLQAQEGLSGLFRRGGFSIVHFLHNKFSSLYGLILLVAFSTFI